MSGRKMWRGMRPARRPILLSPSDSCHPLAPSACSVPTATTSFPPPFQTLVSFAVEKIVFISTVVRTDSAAVIYVPAQTHLIYSAKHNSLTLFWGKTVVYLGYATKSRKLRHSYVHSTPPSSIFYISPFLSLRHSPFVYPLYQPSRTRTPFLQRSLSLFLLSLFAINTRPISYFFCPISSNDTRCVTFNEQVFRVYAFDLLFPRVQMLVLLSIYIIRVTRKLTQATIFVRKPVVRETRRHKSSMRNEEKFAKGKKLSKLFVRAFPFVFFFFFFDLLFH